MLHIQLTLFYPGVGFVSSRELLDNGNPVPAAEAPDVACGDSAAGSKNCILVWASPIGEGASYYQKLKWVHLGIQGFGLITAGPIMEWGYNVPGPPRVTYRGPATSDAAFVLASGSDGSLYNTIGKDVADNSFWDWSTYEPHYTPTGSYGYSPAIGAASGAGEVVVRWQ